MGAGPATQPELRTRMARTLALDALAAEVVGELERRGIRSLLFKGPVTARWLYRDGTPRPYSDVDLLVAPDDFDAAEEALVALGFSPGLPGARRSEYAWHERAWGRDGPRPGWVDLHRGLSWVDPGAPLWETLAADSDRLEVGGRAVEVPRPAANALLVVLHAIQHVGAHQPAADLDRAVAAVETATWQEAARLAARLGVTAPFAAGLRRVAGRAELARELALPEAVTADVHLHLAGFPYTVDGFRRLSEARGVRARARLIAGELLASPGLIRATVPWTARHPLTLPAGYLWRWLVIAWHAPRGLWTWRRAQRSERERRPAAP